MPRRLPLIIVVHDCLVWKETIASTVKILKVDMVASDAQAELVWLRA